MGCTGCTGVQNKITTCSKTSDARPRARLDVRPDLDEPAPEQHHRRAGERGAQQDTQRQRQAQLQRVEWRDMNKVIFQAGSKGSVDDDRNLSLVWCL